MKNINIIFRIPKWEEIPNIDLYLDQVVTLLEDYLEPFNCNKDEKVITKTMINNYVKQSILKAPINKKYNKDHIASLFVICILKQIYSINDINNLIKLSFKNNSSEEAYTKFCTALDKAINFTFYGNDYKNDPTMTNEKSILKNVVSSFASKLYVEKNFLNN